jgi:hypothetical protein
MADGRSLKEAFAGLVAALEKGNLDGFYGAIMPDAVIMDEDLPFRVDRSGFQNHIAFHASGPWEGFVWKPADVRFSTLGDVGSATGFAMFRGKPRDAGFRLRPMLFTQGWTNAAHGWRIASWHQSPIVGHVHRPSPA